MTTEKAPSPSCQVWVCIKVYILRLDFVVVFVLLRLWE